MFCCRVLRLNRDPIYILTTTKEKVMTETGKEPEVITTDDGYKFTRQEDGSYTDRDIVYDSLQALIDAGHVQAEEEAEFESMVEEAIKDPEPPEELVYSMELVRIDFTKDELIDLGLDAADSIRKLKSIEAQKKSAVADFVAREKQVSLEVDELMRKIEDGFEMRRENCLVRYDDPTHMVHFILEHDERGVIIKQRKMTPSEIQRSLPGV